MFGIACWTLLVQMFPIRGNLPLEIGRGDKHMIPEFVRRKNPALVVSGGAGRGAECF